MTWIRRNNFVSSLSSWYMSSSYLCRFPVADILLAIFRLYHLSSTIASRNEGCHIRSRGNHLFITVFCITLPTMLVITSSDMAVFTSIVWVGFCNSEQSRTFTAAAIMLKASTDKNSEALATQSNLYLQRVENSCGRTWDTSSDRPFAVASQYSSRVLFQAPPPWKTL